MAKDYRTATSRKTVKVLSQSQTVAVEEVGIYTIPTGIYLLVEVPFAAWEAGKEDTYLAPPAQLIEQLISGGYVSGASYVQDTDASNLLAGFIDFTVSYTPDDGPALPFTTVVRIPMTQLDSLADFDLAGTTDDPEGKIRAAHDRLVKLAAA